MTNVLLHINGVVFAVLCTLWFTRLCVTGIVRRVGHVNGAGGDFVIVCDALPMPVGCIGLEL